MQIYIAEFLEKLDKHFMQFSQEVYPAELRMELLAYLQQFRGMEEFFENVDEDLKQDIFNKIYKQRHNNRHEV